jgi:hypothetical protein
MEFFYEFHVFKEPIKYTNEIVPVCIPSGRVDYVGREAYATGK